MKTGLSLHLMMLLVAFLLGGCSVFGGGNVYTNPDHGPTDLGYLQVAMPEIPLLPASDWFNAAPTLVDSLHGRVVLFDFWDYTCVNCIRTACQYRGRIGRPACVRTTGEEPTSP